MQWVTYVVSLDRKLAVLADAAKYDASCASSGSKRAGTADGIGHSDGTGICHSYTPDGRCVSLLKVLLTNACIYDCLFCVNRISSDVPRERFSVQELVKLTLDFYRRNYIEGLFLSSGIIRDPDYTMEQLIGVARSLREEHAFGGYIHLKAIPGASETLIAEAGRWADRLSANIELPTESDLQRLAPEKKRDVIEGTMADIRERSDEAREAGPRGPRFAPAGQTTQLVVGATESTDRQILTTATNLYSTHRLRRIYYSAFSPFPKADARLPIRPPELIREHRLYQADWLMRYYGFDAGELTSESEADLSLERDPKLSWALRNRAFFPVDLNRATREQLLRVPGLGVRSVDTILRVRKIHAIRLEHLAKLKVSMRKVRPFVTALDHNPDSLRIDDAKLESRVAPPVQLALFGAATSALTGEL